MQLVAQPPVVHPAFPEDADAPAGASGSVAAPKKSLRRRFTMALDWLFGCAALVGALAACSVIPALNLMSLGYLLNVSATVARTGRLRDGFVGIRKASVIGSAVAGTWLVLWPARILSVLWRDAELIAPGSSVANGWRLGLIAITVATFAHIAWALLRGGRLRHFFWPEPLRFVKWLRTPGKLDEMQRGFSNYVLGLRLPFYFWLGLRGFAGALAWLAVPVLILLVSTRLQVGGTAILSLLGLLLLLPVVMYLPFLQAHFAVTGTFRSMFEVRVVRDLFCRAPLAFWLALLVTLLFAIPLYLLKIELTPRELAWLPSLVFVVFIFPARILTGWAMARALKHERPRFFLTRWLGRLAILPVALVYVLIVYASPYISWNGALGLLEQHAFLVPAPLIAL